MIKDLAKVASEGKPKIW